MKLSGLLIVAVIAVAGYQQYTKKPAQECVNSKLPPAADGTVYELEVCINGGKELNVGITVKIKERNTVLHH